jgi:kynureninase
MKESTKGYTTEQASELHNYQATLEYAIQQDQEDALGHFRSQFFIPRDEQGNELLYFCGNSLGPQPKTVPAYIQQELKDWQELAVKGHMQGKNPWFYYHHFTQKQAAHVVGAKPEEVVMMNTLSVNLHLMMVSFYQPKGRKYKIVVEGSAFPSDHYAVESQIRFHGYDPQEGILELHPREGEHTLRKEDIIQTIEQHADEIALVLIGGVNFYTGQYFDMPAITGAAHEAGALAGWDLAHGAGNVPVKLHNWDVDFAVWCSYKYLNSGPGGVGGAFVHEKHGNNPHLPRFAGWWGYDEDTRFDMQKGFKPMEGAAGWQLSNAQVLSMAANWASLAIFEEAGIERLREKSRQLTGYLAFLVEEVRKNSEQAAADLHVITPSNPDERGCQLSILTSKENGRHLFEKISERNIVADWREPNVIRLAPAPLYNRFEEVFHFYEQLRAFYL